MKRLLELLAVEPLPPSWKVKLILTDFNRSLLMGRMSLPCLQEMLRQGLVDIAVLDARENPTTGQGLDLLYSQTTIAPSSVTGPLVIMGNYAVSPPQVA